MKSAPYRDRCILTLLTLAEDKLHENNIDYISHRIKAVLKDHYCEIHRWDPWHLLVQLRSHDGHHALGQSVLDECFDDIDGINIIDTEPCQITNAPRILFEVESADASAVHDSLHQVIAPFSAAFTYITLRKVADTNGSLEPGVLPALGVNILFPGAYQTKAERVLERLQRSPWRSVAIPKHIEISLDHPEKLFCHTSLTIPLIGVKTGCPALGVQLVIFVQNEENFFKMKEFYQTVMGGKQSPWRTVKKTHFTYCVFGLSSKAELVLAFYPGLKVASLRNSVIYIHVSDVSDVKGIIKLGADHWYTNDPEGNRVILYKMLASPESASISRQL